MKITKAQLKKIILEEAQLILKEAPGPAGFDTTAADYGVSLSQPQDLRPGRGLYGSEQNISRSTPDASSLDFPHWSEVNEALTIIYQQLSAMTANSKILQQDKAVAALITMIKAIAEKHPKLNLGKDLTETSALYGATTKMWEDVKGLAKYIKQILTNTDAFEDLNVPLSEYIMDLVDYVERIADIRVNNMTGLVHDLSDGNWLPKPAMDSKRRK